MLDKEIRIRFTLRQAFCRAWIPPVLVIALFLVFAYWTIDGLPKVNWPSWVQAIGSVSAILAAVWVAERGHQREDHAGLMENARLGWLADCGAERLDRALELLAKNEVDRLTFGTKTGSIEGVQDSVAILNSLMSQKLPHGLIRPVFRAVSLADEVVKELETARSNYVRDSGVALGTTLLAARRWRRELKLIWVEIYDEYARYAKAVDLPYTQRVFQ